MADNDHILPSLNRLDELFRESDVSQYSLTVQAGERSFSYCILDPRTKTYVGVGELKSPVARGPGSQEIILPPSVFLQKAVASFPLLTKPFGSVTTIWEGNRFTLIPEKYYEESSAKSFLSFNLAVEPTEVVGHDHLKDFQAVSVYVVPETVNQTIKRIFPETRILHHATILAIGLYRQYKDSLGRPRLFVNLRDNWFDLVILNQQGLVYMNAFEFRLPEDMVYFLLYTMDQTGFSPEKAEVIIHGKILRNSPQWNLLAKYIRQVELGRRDRNWTFGRIFNEVPQQAMFPLLAANSCG